jgi:hypothetical protein
MPKNGDFKNLVRARMVKTGERYATARMRVLAGGENSARAPIGFSAPGAEPHPIVEGPALFQLKIRLEEIEPTIWRRVLVSADTTLDRLHDVIQAAFGWWDYHLHQFHVDGTLYAIPDPEWDETVMPARIDERTMTIRDLLNAQSIIYEYDFGDGWKHAVEIESVAMAREPGVTYPICTHGERACPREDCGGVDGHHHLVEALADPLHEDHAQLKTWAGEDYDPDKFDRAAANRALRKVRKGRAIRR